MGVLGHQPERTRQYVRFDDVRCQLIDLCSIAKELKVDISIVVQLYASLVDANRLHFQIENGDYTDEHIAGLADVFREQTDKLFELLESVVPKQD